MGDADILRRAMGKKDPEEMASQREQFVEGAKKKKIDAQRATEIFDQMETFARYGFNKSHSAAYALISYQTAYLKAHFPVEFMAALMSSERRYRQGDQKPGRMPRARNRGLPPDINEVGPILPPSATRFVLASRRSKRRREGGQKSSSLRANVRAGLSPSMTSAGASISARSTGASSRASSNAGR
jgi:DNA polymerase III alpha subunit